MSNLHSVGWTQIPAPEDDGKARHLTGTRIPSIALSSTHNEVVKLSELNGRTLVYAYPMTGRPDTPLPDDWDNIGNVARVIEWLDAAK